MALFQLLLFLSLASFQSSLAQFFMNENFTEVREECLTENSVTADEIHDGWKMHHNVSEKLLCFHKCLLEKKGLIDENGIIQKEKIPEVVTLKHNEKREEIFTCIGNIEKIETCENVLEVMHCFPRRRKD
ncbi:general odorant-binding protein 56h-like [Tribolium madens]|uniref:general odorant-binding protein 56h-like n=1 Tax=Tribolium madens TaxID=41895 RepID=UPI001CF73BB9|nr:general odorant-binding protein 56h-like [Tribolium madens]